jgi:hypothetical protein
MKISNELIAVLNMVMNLDTRPEGFGFGIPSNILSPASVTSEQTQALEAAGFEWQDTETGGLYFAELT